MICTHETKGDRLVIMVELSLADLAIRVGNLKPQERKAFNRILGTLDEGAAKIKANKEREKAK